MSHVWTSQPQIYTGVSALARRLGCVRLLTGLGGANLYDAVTRSFIAPAAGASAVTRVSTRRGYGARTNGTTAYWDISAPTNANRNAYLWVGMVHTSGAIVLRDDTSSGGTIPIWQSGGQFRYRNGATDYTAAGTFSDNTEYAILATAGASYGQLWVDGNLLVNDSSIAFIDITSPFKLSRNGASGPNYDTTTVLLAIFDKPVAAYAQRLSRNPWQLFAPLRRRVVVGFSAGGGAGNVGSVFTSGVFGSNVFRRAA